MTAKMNKMKTDFDKEIQTITANEKERYSRCMDSLMQANKERSVFEKEAEVFKQLE